MDRIHSTALVEDGARLGPDVKVGPFACVAAGAEIGEGCVIGPHVVVHSGVFLGPRCTLHAGVVLGDLPQDLKFDERTPSYVRIGEGCTLREGVTVHRGSKAESVTRVGKDCFLMVNSHVGHDVHLEDKVILANGALLAGHVRVEEGVFVGGNTAVHQFCRVGRLAFLGGEAAVITDVLPFCMIRPGSANTLMGLNVVGMRRAGMGKEERDQVKYAFDLFFRSDLSLTEAVERIRSEFSSGPALEMADFVRGTKRGICRLSAH